MALRDRVAAWFGYTPAAEMPGQVREAVDRVVRDYSLAWPTPMLWGLFGGAGSSSGVPVTPLSALQAATVYMCVKRLAEDIAGLHFVIERLADDRWSADPQHPLNNLLTRPNRWMTPFEFWRYMVMSLELRGNAMAVIKRGWDGQPEELIPLNWDRVSVLLSPRGTLFYNVSHPQIGFGVTFHQDDVIHVRGLTVDGGYLGMTPIAVAQDVVGLSIAAQQHGAVFFRQGATVAKVLKHPGRLSPEAATRIGQSIRDAYGGVQNAHKWAVLEEGMDIADLQMTNEDAQFLQTRAFQVIEICRMFGVPPHKVYQLDKATFNSLEQQDQAYVGESIRPRTTNIAQACNGKLLFESDMGLIRLRIDHSEMLQGDMKSRAEFYGSTVNNGLMNRNEARAGLGLPPVPGGDAFRVPANTTLLNADGTMPPKPPPGAPGSTAGGLGSDVITDKDNGGPANASDTELADQAVL
jgi:HK97 family phage portal protein